MDGITIVIMLVLFVLAMIFVFSTALLTPYLGKKNLVFVVLLGLIVGVVGGAFLLSPIVDDIPDFTRTIIEESVDGTDVMELDLSTNGNLTQIIQNISSITGVQNVQYEGITIKIDEDFDTPYEKTTLISKLNNSNENVSNIEEVDDKTFFIRIEDGGDPQSVLTSIYKTFSTETYTHLKYTSMQANATVVANNVTKVMSAVQNSGAVVLNVTGPTEDQIDAVEQFVPDKSNVVLFSGILGVIVAITGFFIDTIFTFTSKSKKRNKMSEREKIKRKTIPEAGRDNKFKKPTPKRDSIDIFDDSFDDSSRQTIGSNRHFKPITDDGYKEKPKFKPKGKSDSKGPQPTGDGKTKSKSRFSGLFNKLSKDNKKPSEDKKTHSDDKKGHSKKEASNTRKAPRIRPKHKD